jgi:copper chaperone CopZ
MKTVTLKIEGMHCNGCAETVRSLVDSEPGVRAADVSFKDSQARILFDPQAISEEELVKVIEKGGYHVPAQAS